MRNQPAQDPREARSNRLMLVVIVVGVLIGTVASARAAVVGDTMGDTTYESVYGHGGEQTLTAMFSEYRHTGTGQSLVVGDVNQGEDPTQSHQSQYQRFHVTEDVSLSITLIGGYAGYKNIFGVYTYDEGEDPILAALTLTPLLTHKVDPAGTTISFNVAAGQSFGFYLNADGHNSSKGIYYSENFRNTDGASRGVQTDHFLMYESDAGLLIAMEDLAYGSNGRLGDQDYQDMVVGLLTHADGSAINFSTSVPEPATLALVVAGLVVLTGRARRR